VGASQGSGPQEVPLFIFISFHFVSNIHANSGSTVGVVTGYGLYGPGTGDRVPGGVNILFSTSFTKYMDLYLHTPTPVCFSRFAPKRLTAFYTNSCNYVHSCAPASWCFSGVLANVRFDVCLTVTNCSRTQLCGDYEECRLLGYKTPLRTSQETHYVSATESSQLMLCKI
jgi:hypothetical protein